MTTRSGRCLSCSTRIDSLVASVRRPRLIQEVTVRRLKPDLTTDDGKPRFPQRRIVMLEVDHPTAEREVHAQLGAYAAARARRLGADDASRAGADFIATLLKKRLFSSPAAFLRTLEVHRETLTRPRRAAARPTPSVLQRLFDDAAAPWMKSPARTASVRRRGRRSTLQPRPKTKRSNRRGARTARHDARLGSGRRLDREDARSARLLDWVQEQVKPGARFTDERGDRVHRVSGHPALSAGATRHPGDRR